MTIPYLITADTILVGTKSIPRTAGHAEQVLEAIRRGDLKEALELMDPREAIVAFSKGKLHVDFEDGVVFYNEKEVSGLLHNRILDMARNNLPVTALTNFLDRVERNPLYDVRERLYEFIEYGKLPLTDRGTFLTHKIVRGDGYDKYSRTNLHTEGAVFVVPFRDVDTNPNNLCSYGLHVYSRDYSRSVFYKPGDKIYVTEVCPSCVCAIPTDYNHTKMRVTSYKVVEEVTQERDPEYFGSSVYEFNVQADRFHVSEPEPEPNTETWRVSLIGLDEDGNVYRTDVTVELDEGEGEEDVAVEALNRWEDILNYHGDFYVNVDNDTVRVTGAVRIS